MLFSLFFLSCVLLCSSVLVLSLSDRYAAGNEAVQKEQSRLLAHSGWNMALEQLQLYGKTDAIAEETTVGTIDVSLKSKQTKPLSAVVHASGTAGEYSRTVSGTVQYFPFPFQDAADWAVVDSVGTYDEASIVLVNDAQYLLRTDCSEPLGITSGNGAMVSVMVEDEVAVDTLYICGDLHLSEDALLTAACIRVSGNIYGAENIVCEDICSSYNDAVPYQIRVQSRTAD